MKKTTAALALAATIAFAPAASAHDELTGTTPKNGTTVTSAPEAVELTFGERPLAVGNQIAVKAPDGSTSTITPKVSGTSVSAPFTAHGDGAYTVTWRVVSSDGHPVSGSYGFTLKGSANSTTSSPTSGSPSPRATATTTFDSSAPSPAAGAHKDADGSTAWAAFAAAGAVVVLVIAAVALMSRRRRGQ